MSLTVVPTLRSNSKVPVSCSTNIGTSCTLRTGPPPRLRPGARRTFTSRVAWIGPIVRAMLSPAHPLARRDVPLSQANTVHNMMLLPSLLVPSASIKRGGFAVGVHRPSLYLLVETPSNFAKLYRRSEASTGAEPGRKAGTDRSATVGTTVAERIPEGFRPAKPERIAPRGT